VVDESLVTEADQILLIFDSCQSGGAAADVLDAIKRMTLFEGDAPPDLVALSSCLAYEQAYSGAFVKELLAAVHEGFGDYEPPERHQYFDIVDLRDELRRRLGSSQTVHVAGTGGRRTFPNPRFRRSLGDRRLDGSQPIATAVDTPTLASSGVELMASGSMVGRSPTLESIVGWAQSDAHGVMVITGPPGSGKTAILSFLTALADRDVSPAYRLSAARHHPTLGLPTIGLFDAFLTIRDHTLESCAEEIARQIDIATDPLRSPATSLLQALADDRRRVRVVLDGLDEAQPGAARAIGLDLIAALGSMPGCQVLVGTRPLTDIETDDPDAWLNTLKPVEGQLRVIDLIASFQTSDIETYVRRLLSGAHVPPEGITPELVHAIVETSRENFLVAQLLVRRVGDAPTDGMAAGQDLRALFESWAAQDLAGLLEGEIERAEDPVRLREVLRPLAFAFGSGLPRREVWAELATALAESGRAYSQDDVTAVVDGAGWYLIEATAGGEAVYRLSHQLLVTFLKSSDP
jgi:hypothetical protein